MELFVPCESNAIGGLIMNIMIIHCHTANRGDEAAVHALVDELNSLYDNISITVALRGETKYPNMPQNVRMIKQFMPSDMKSKIAYYVAKLTKCKVKISGSGKKFLKEAEKADIILHAPGGPSIGDTYFENEASYLLIYNLLIEMKKKYMFYAPSMGPFKKEERNAWRKKVLENAQAVVLRDPISAEYVKELLPNIKIYQTLDSAFQHDIDMEGNERKMRDFRELDLFVSEKRKCIGITITDLLWHPVYSKNESICQNVVKSFSAFLDNLVKQDYRIVFVPQLYGSGNDIDLMRQFAKNEDDYFVIPSDQDVYDTYFQQYIIGKMFAVIGMRYHSNIFSAKMGTPFISVSYEQKMSGFMKKMGLEDYCISVENLSCDRMIQSFDKLYANYEAYKNYLNISHDVMKADSYQTTQIVQKILG